MNVLAVGIDAVFLRGEDYRGPLVALVLQHIAVLTPIIVAVRIGGFCAPAHRACPATALRCRAARASVASRPSAVIGVLPILVSHLKSPCLRRMQLSFHGLDLSYKYQMVETPLRDVIRRVDKLV